MASFSISDFLHLNSASNSSYTTEENQYKLRVGGRGVVKLQPNMASITIGVSSENEQLKLAQEENARIVTNIIDTIKEIGIPSKNIQTQSYTVDPIYEYTEGKQIFKGYRVSHILRVSVEEIDKIGEIIDESVEQGANIVNNINFTVADPTVYYQLALEAAIEDALAKAMTISNKFKLKLSPIPLEITEQGSQYANPVDTTFLKSSASTTPIQTGEIDITAQIEVVFTYSSASTSSKT